MAIIWEPRARQTDGPTTTGVDYYSIQFIIIIIINDSIIVATSVIDRWPHFGISANFHHRPLSAAFLVHRGRVTFILYFMCTSKPTPFVWSPADVTTVQPSGLTLPQFSHVSLATPHKPREKVYIITLDRLAVHIIL